MTEHKKYKNKARCKNCDDIIESKYRHDWVKCSCFEDKEDTLGIFLDGGNAYWRCGGNFKNIERMYEELS